MPLPPMQESDSATLQVLRQVIKQMDSIESKVAGMSLEVTKLQVAMATLSATIMAFEHNLSKLETSAKNDILENRSIINENRATILEHEKRLTTIESETRTRAALVGGVVGVIVSVCISAGSIILRPRPGPAAPPPNIEVVMPPFPNTAK